jgi:hypothetical protein
MHRGNYYRSEWKVRQRGDGPYARLISARFNNAVKRLGLNKEPRSLRTDLFRPPTLKDKGAQMGLFD